MLSIRRLLCEASQNQLTIDATESDSADSGGESGWTVGAAHYKDNAGSQWEPTPDSEGRFQFSLRGTVVQLHPEPFVRTYSCDGKLILNWAIPDTDISSYDVQWKSGDEMFSVTERTITISDPDPFNNSHTLEELTNGTTYTVRLSALDGEGLLLHILEEIEAAPSNMACISGVDFGAVLAYTAPVIVQIEGAPAGTIVSMQYRSVDSGEWSEPEVMLLAEAEDSVTFDLRELDSGTTYEVRAWLGSLPFDPSSPAGQARFTTGKVAPGQRLGGGGVGRILRIEPTVRNVAVSAGDAVRLSFDVYGRQLILNNDLSEGHVFVWDDGSAGGRVEATDRANTIIYTAPSTPGTHVVTATSPPNTCLVGDDADETVERCTAKFTITVRRSSAVSEDRPAPKNPVGEIPSVLADAEGRQYDVFTPEEGGRFDGGEVMISAEPGVVPNLEILGVRVDAAGSASNIGMTTHRYTLVGDRYDVLAVDAAGASISSYVLNAPLEVCVPLPPAARSNISDVAIVANNLDGTLTVLAASVRITQAGVDVCGNLGTLPASIAVGTSGAPEAIPAPTPDPDAIEDPDTGGYAPSASGVLILMMLIFGDCYCYRRCGAGVAPQAR